ncbi:MAG TPA: hypothetical protein VHR44_05655 [Beijerinckiaceae bacterium]|jgi:hypothetical protein|nr:hypothetical protein [Beijerinckiaceae bacterium]
MNSLITRREHLAILLAGAGGTLAAGTHRAWAQSVPWSSGTERPSIAVPPNATDCHHHIYDARFPAAPALKIIASCSADLA